MKRPTTIVGVSVAALALCTGMMSATAHPSHTAQAAEAATVTVTLRFDEAALLRAPLVRRQRAQARAWQRAHRPAPPVVVPVALPAPPVTVPPTTTPPPPPPPVTAPPAPATSGSGACGGDLPSCCIMMRESGGSLTVMNPSGAAGKWQFMPSTWQDFMGYPSAADAPEWVQDERARQVWAGGAGASAWAGDGC